MKRISELEAEAKRVRQQADEEIARIRAAESFTPLINTTLAAWKAKLCSAASHEKKDWKLVIYSYGDDCLLDYGRSDYNPNIFSPDKPWLVKQWTAIRGHTGSGVIVAYADNPEALLPEDDALRLLGCFRLPYAVMPSCLKHPKSFWGYDWDPKLEEYFYSIGCVWRPDDVMQGLPSMAGIENPDPTNPEHIKAIYKSKWKESQVSPEFEKELKELDEKRESLLRQLQFHRIAVDLKNKLRN